MLLATSMDPWSNIEKHQGGRDLQEWFFLYKRECKNTLLLLLALLTTSQFFFQLHWEGVSLCGSYPTPHLLQPGKNIMYSSYYQFFWHCWCLITDSLLLPELPCCKQNVCQTCLRFHHSLVLHQGITSLCRFISILLVVVEDKIQPSTFASTSSIRRAATILLQGLPILLTGL